jgi:hypothetical protein
VAPAKSGCASSTTQPSDSSTLRCGCSALVTRGSIGRPPKSGDQAILALRKLRPSGRPKSVPGSAIDSGARASGPAIADSRKAVSSTVRPMGPSTPSESQAFGAGQLGTRPGDGLKPTTLQ